MRRATLSLHGHFVEAYLYFDFAWLISKDGLVRAFDIERFCTERLNGSGSAAAKLFANNQRLADSRFASDVNNLLESETPIDVSEADVDKFSYIFKADFDFKSIFDLKFYYGRAYLSTENSIQQFTAKGRNLLEFSRIGHSARDKLDEKHVWDHSSRQLQCRYGVVSAACGRGGGLLGLKASSEDPDFEISFEPFTDRSFGIELNANALTSLRTLTDVEYFSAHSDRSLRPSSRVGEDETERRGGLELKGVDGRGFKLQSDLIKGMFKDSDSKALRVYLFKSTVWIETEDGKLQRVKTAASDALLDAPELLGHFSAPGRILSTANTDVGVVIESDDHVYLRRSGHWYTLLYDQVYSVRGYMNSKRYRNVVTAVRRKQVDLIAITS